MIESTTFDFGETKKVCIKIQSTCDEPFEVTNAKWSLQTKSGEEESSGECEVIFENATCSIVSALIQPMRNHANYILEYQYDIQPEHLIHQVIVRVS